MYLNSSKMTLADCPIWFSKSLIA